MRYLSNIVSSDVKNIITHIRTRVVLHSCNFAKLWFPLPLGAWDGLRYLSLVMRKPAFCICENKDADQLRGNREADQRLIFRYTGSTIPLLSIYEISSLYSSCVVVQPGLCRTWSETPKTGFLRTRLILLWQSLSLPYNFSR